MRRLQMTPKRIEQKEIIVKAFKHSWAYASRAEFEWLYKLAKKKLEDN